MQEALIGKASSTFGRSISTKYDYQHAINGFAVELTLDEAKALGSMSGVVSVQKERAEHILTDVGPAWINAPAIWNANNNGSQGEGLVIAVLDSGINSDHPSFAAVGDDGYAHQNPLGSGSYLPGSYCDTVDPTFCNDKLIGAWDMTAIDGTVPEDDDGHGSHTTSTAAGNVVNNATLNAPTTSIDFNISGVAPHANIIHYDVCQRTCPGAELVAAINQVVIDAGNLPDGIAALNYSISGGGDPYNDTVELGFLAAVEAGIYVSASAGNDGPQASTVAHLGPWVATTAASTHNRAIDNTLINLNSDAASIGDFSGSSLSVGYGPAPIIHANTTAFDPTGQCLDPFPANTFSGEIVMCDRGTIARTEKGENVLAGGAGGSILGNLGQGEGTVADGHFLPAIHLGDSDAIVLRDWLTANTGTTGTITASAIDLSDSNGDLMGGFSSRGPQLAFNVLKPDVTAPGVNIMGADSNAAVPAGPEYQIISGTSMSSPHNAGAGALITAAQPDWTPTEIKSAIMLTASNVNTLKEDAATPTDPFDLGAGRVDLARAVNSGVVLSESIGNFLAADPATGGDPSTLNLASMMNGNCVGICSWTRTVTNKSGKNGKWYVAAQGNGFDVDVVVSPQFQGNNHNLKLKKGQSATITVTVDNYTSDADTWQFGTVTLDPKGRGSRPSRGNQNIKKPLLSMPIAVKASKATDSTLFNKSVDVASASDGDTLTYELSITNGLLAGQIDLTDVVPDGAAFVPGSETSAINNGTTSSPWAYDGGSNTLTWSGELDQSELQIVPDPFGSPAGYLPMAGFGAPLASGCNGDCDDGGYFFNVPAFTYNGETYTQVLMSVNGTLEAGVDSGGFSSFANQDLPNAAAPNNILAPFWRDLNQSAGGEMYINVLGFGPFQWTIYEWEAVPHFGSTDTITMQIWIGNNGFASEGDIHFVYGNVDNAGAGATVGVENRFGTVGTNYFFNGSGIAPAVNDELRILTVDGGTATFGFEVTTDCSEDPVINRAGIATNDRSEGAIAVTSCESVRSRSRR